MSPRSGCETRHRSPFLTLRSAITADSPLVGGLLTLKRCTSKTALGRKRPIPFGGVRQEPPADAAQDALGAPLRRCGIARPSGGYPVAAPGRDTGDMGPVGHTDAPADLATTRAASFRCHVLSVIPHADSPLSTLPDLQHHFKFSRLSATRFRLPCCFRSPD